MSTLVINSYVVYPSLPVPVSFSQTYSRAGEIAYTNPGTYSFTVPTGVTSISAVCVGGGGAGGQRSQSGNGGSAIGGGGGGLRYINNLPVTPGEVLTVVVGAGAVATALDTKSPNGGTSSISGTRSGSTVTILSATGGTGGGLVSGGTGGMGGTGGGGTARGAGAYGGTVGGYDGGSSNSNTQNQFVSLGGGGAGGYSGNGGSALGPDSSFSADFRTSGYSGAGGGGGGGACARGGGGGGGVSIFGEGSSGTGENVSKPNPPDASATGLPTPAGGGSGGSPGVGFSTNVSSSLAAGYGMGTGGLYGGGGGGLYAQSSPYVNVLQPDQGTGASGAVRIIWGSNREFPSTRVESLYSAARSFVYPYGSVRYYEGQTVIFSVTSTTSTETLYWTIEQRSGTINDSDFDWPRNAFTNGGTVDIVDGVGKINISLAVTQTAAAQSFRLRLRTGSITGTIVATSATVSIAQPSASGSLIFGTAGVYNFIVPPNVTSISAVCVGGGGAAGQGARRTAEGTRNTTANFANGGGGGGLRYINDFPVAPGEILTLYVGAGGYADTAFKRVDGGDSFIVAVRNNAFVKIVEATGGGGASQDAGGSRGSGTTIGAGPYGGTIGGANGGSGGAIPLGGSRRAGGGGGAGGYSGVGGNGGASSTSSGGDGGNASSGSGGGGGGCAGWGTGGGGGGVGLTGKGLDGVGGIYNTDQAILDANPATGGSGGNSGEAATRTDDSSTPYARGANGGAYGGGAGAINPSGDGTVYDGNYGNGGSGGIRIIWGPGRSYPSNAA